MYNKTGSRIHWIKILREVITQYRWSIILSSMTLIFALLILSLLGDVRRATRADRSVEHTLEVMIETQKIWSAIQDTEAAQKTYLLVSSEENANSYQQSTSQVWALLDGLHHMIADNPEQQDLFENLNRAVAARLELTSKWVNSKRTEDLNNSFNNTNLADIRQTIGIIVSQEQVILSQKRQSSSVYESRHNLTVLATAIVGALTIAIAGAALLARRNSAIHDARMFEARTRLNLAQEAGQIGLWEWNFANDEIFWSSIQFDLHDLNHFVTPSIKDLIVNVHPDDEQSVKLAFERSKKDQSSIEIIYRVFRNGNIHWLEARGQFFPGSYDFSPKLIGVTVDVSDQHAINETLKQTNEDLEIRVNREVSAREQAASDLAQARKMDALGQLTGGVAHDFNNLLQAVLSSATMISKKADEPDEVRRMIDVVRKAAERGASLTTRMLAFARQQDLKPDIINPSQLVDGMISMLKRTIGPRIQITTQYASNWPVSVDANQLELAILNLVVNARDAMSEGGQILIKINNIVGHPDSGPDLNDLGWGEWVVVEVEDTGDGMDQQTLQRAIEPFFTTKGIGRGTGLGLPMVHGLAAQSGGALVIKSELNKGTRAQIWLPRSFEKITENIAEVEETESIVEEPSNGLTVLLVDDDPLVLDVATDTLEDLGYSVLTASSGESALSMIEAEFEADIMITDQSMPGMTGVDLAELIRSIKPKMAILLATGYSEFPLDSKILDCPPLRKPYTTLSLKKAIRLALSNCADRLG